MVKKVDRVGRMADTLEFSDVALPKNRFSEELLEQLRAHVPSLLEEDGDDLLPGRVVERIGAVSGFDEPGRFVRAVVV